MHIGLHQLFTGFKSKYSAYPHLAKEKAEELIENASIWKGLFRTPSKGTEGHNIRTLETPPSIISFGPFTIEVIELRSLENLFPDRDTSNRRAFSRTYADLLQNLSLCKPDERTNLLELELLSGSINNGTLSRDNEATILQAAKSICARSKTEKEVEPPYFEKDLDSLGLFAQNIKKQLMQTFQRLEKEKRNSGGSTYGYLEDLYNSALSYIAFIISPDNKARIFKNPSTFGNTGIFWTFNIPENSTTNPISSNSEIVACLNDEKRKHVIDELEVVMNKSFLRAADFLGIKKPSGFVLPSIVVVGSLNGSGLIAGSFIGTLVEARVIEEAIPLIESKDQYQLDIASKMFENAFVHELAHEDRDFLEIKEREFIIGRGYTYMCEIPVHAIEILNNNCLGNDYTKYEIALVKNYAYPNYTQRNPDGAYDLARETALKIVYKLLSERGHTPKDYKIASIKEKIDELEKTKAGKKIIKQAAQQVLNSKPQTLIKIADSVPSIAIEIIQTSERKSVTEVFFKDRRLTSDAAIEITTSPHNTYICVGFNPESFSEQELSLEELKGKDSRTKRIIEQATALSKIDRKENVRRLIRFCELGVPLLTREDEYLANQCRVKVESECQIKSSRKELALKILPEIKKLIDSGDLSGAIELAVSNEFVDYRELENFRTSFDRNLNNDKSDSNDLNGFSTSRYFINI